MTVVVLLTMTVLLSSLGDGSLSSLLLPQLFSPLLCPLMLSLDDDRKVGDSLPCNGDSDCGSDCGSDGATINSSISNRTDLLLSPKQPPRSDP